MYVCSGAGRRPHCPSSVKDGLNAALEAAFRGGAITGMLVVGLGLLGVAGYYALLSLPALLPTSARWSGWLLLLADLDLRPARRHLHQGADVGADLVGKVRPVSPKMIRVIQQ